MFKLIRLLIEALVRGAFVIDDKGKIHELEYHGDILYEKGFEKLLDKALSVVDNNLEKLDDLITFGSRKILSILDDAGFITGGIWSPSRRQLYFTINPSKMSSGAKDGALKKIMDYKPNSIYFEDLKTHKFGDMEIDEFAGEYL